MSDGLNEAFKGMNFNRVKEKEENYPDAKLHKITSFIKSGVRIIGYGFLPFSMEIACAVLLISEFVGIIEELV
tara:strand:+ start:168 stop:386 length:219 start_codon:yes stop_codon:yes gene_type:complete